MKGVNIMKNLESSCYNKKNQENKIKSNTSYDEVKTSSSKQKNQQIKDGINLDYDYNTEYGDGDIPDIDK